jgi:hypothetical protein
MSGSIPVPGFDDSFTLFVRVLLHVAFAFFFLFDFENRTTLFSVVRAEISPRLSSRWQPSSRIRINYSEHLCAVANHHVEPDRSCSRPWLAHPSPKTPWASAMVNIEALFLNTKKEKKSTLHLLIFAKVYFFLPKL